MEKEKFQMIYDQLLLEIQILPVDPADLLGTAKSALTLVNEALSCVGPDSAGGADWCLARIYGLRFYYRELLWLEYHKPVAGKLELVAFYKQEIDFVQHFFIRHAGRYQAFRVALMELDVEDLPVDQVMDWAAMDTVLGLEDEVCAEDGFAVRFFGYELLLEELMRRLELLDNAGIPVISGYGDPLLWTGKLVNLVELAYGLYETGQVNNGRASLTDIFKCLKACFQLEVKVPARIYQDMIMRKRVSTVQFLEEMQVAVLKRMDADLGYKGG